MSRESAVAFYERLESEPELAERLKAMPPQEAERLVRNDLGYDFTKEEIRKIVFQKNSELSETELRAIVGGTDKGQTLLGDLNFIDTCGA